MDHRASWPQVKALFQQALDQPDDAREQWLRDTCCDDAALIAEVRSLLAARGAPDRVGAGVAQLLAPLNESDEAGVQLGSVIGPYRLVSQLGAGGMGRVYLAERVDGQFKQQVALKLIRSELAAPELIQRFLRERETLSRLNHPNIAQLHDGGVSSGGAPYFTLEYVNGAPITQWCDDHRLGIRDRVGMMLKVCDAVEHAHRNLIVHRDIKPSNILVAQNGEPKLLDFGIAKPLEQNANELTGAEIRPMTRDYAAPEQILGNPVTTATDVYALGVLLYRLLSGRMPYRNAALGRIAWAKGVLDEQPEPLERAAERTAPNVETSHDEFGIHESGFADSATIAQARGSTPAALRRILRGDLDRIVQRAMAKEPTMRYPHVNALASDIVAYLDGRAIAGGTRTYRARKFLRKFWLPLSAAGALLSVTVISAAIMFVDARKIEREAQTTTAVKEFLVDLFRSADPSRSNGKDVTARELVSRGAARITAMDHQPLLRGELESILGEIYDHLDQSQEGERVQRLAITDLTVSGASPELIAAANAELANAQQDNDAFDAAAKTADDAIARYRSIDPLPRTQLARILRTRSYIALALHDFETAWTFASEGVTIARNEVVPKRVLAEALEMAGKSASGKHDFIAAESFLREALSVRRSISGEDDLSIAIGLVQLADAVDRMGRIGEVYDIREHAYAIAASKLGDNDPRLVDIRGEYLESLRIFGQYAEADRQVALLEKFYSSLPDDEPSHFVRYSQKASLELAERKFADAERDSGKMADACARILGAGSPMCGSVDLLAAQIHHAEGRSDLAKADLARTIARETASGKSTMHRLLVQSTIEEGLGNFEGGMDVAQQALAMERTIHGETTYEMGNLYGIVGSILAKTGRRAEAESALRKAHSILDESAAHRRIPAISLVDLDLAETLSADPKRRDEALTLSRSALSDDLAYFGADDTRTQRAQRLVDELSKG